MSACPLCGAVTETFLRRENVPVHQHLLCRSEQEARDIRRGTLDMHVCRRCGFVFNAAFDSSLLDYGADYENSQTASEVFSAYIETLCKRIAARVAYDQAIVARNGERPVVVVELGCGKGAFLTQLVEPRAEWRGVGFDTSYVGPLHAADGRIEFRREIYGPDTRLPAVEVLVSRHVIEHVGDPVELMRAVRASVGERTRVFFETPCVNWILRNGVVWDFFYEHCSLFTGSSLAALFRSNGFAVEDVAHVFDGQYLWIEATPASSTTSLVPGATPELASAYSDAESRLVAALHSAVGEAAGRGKVALWGAGAKGATLVNLLDPDGELIDALVDLNPAKQGHFVPGSGHPIVDWRELTLRRVRTAFLMNENYRAENERLLAEAGMDVELRVLPLAQF